MAEFKWFGHNCFRIRAREGDREALADLVERTRLRLFALAYAELRHYEDAHDAVALLSRPGRVALPGQDDGACEVVGERRGLAAARTDGAQ